VTTTEAICTAIVGGFTVLGAAVRWSAGILNGVAMRVVKSIDDSTAAWKETSATVSKLTERLAAMEGQLAIAKKVEDAVDEVVDEVSGVHEAAQDKPTRVTPITGYSIQNPRRGNGGRL